MHAIILEENKYKQQMIMQLIELMESLYLIAWKYTIRPYGL